MTARPVIVEAGKPPIVNGALEERMRVGCGSATIGMFAKQWFGKVDEVVVVDDHITGVLSEHQAGKLLGVRETGIRMKGRRSTPGRYFQVARARNRLGRNRHLRSAFHHRFLQTENRVATSAPAHGQHDGRAARLLRTRRRFAAGREGIAGGSHESVERIKENCEPALSTVLFMGGAGGSLARRRHGQSREAHSLGET